MAVARSFVTLALFLAWLAASPKCVCAQSMRGHDYEVKSAFLLNFAKLTEWPEGALSGGTTIRLCVIGNEQVRAQLVDATKGKILAGKLNAVVTEPTKLEDVRKCNLLFVDASQTKAAVPILQNVKGLPILTVGETKHFDENGGVISFYSQGETLRFSINLDAAQDAHLKFDSRLLGYAQVVHDSKRSQR